MCQGIGCQGVPWNSCQRRGLGEGCQCHDRGRLPGRVTRGEAPRYDAWKVLIEKGYQEKCQGRGFVRRVTGVTCLVKGATERILGNWCQEKSS